MPKHSQLPANPLMEKFITIIAEINLLEKQLVRIYQKLVKASHTAELQKCLSPESTDCDKHLQRIQLIKTSLGRKMGQIKPSASEVIPKFKTASPSQDLEIIVYALKLQNQKLAHYEMLHPLACAMNLQTEASLLEQTITDNRNTKTWLRQIVQHILSPLLAKAAD